MTARPSRLRMALYRLLLLVGIIAAWQLASGPLVPEFFIGKPVAILAALRAQVITGNLFFHVGITATEAFVGFVVGVAAGVAAGVLPGRIPFLADLLQPFILAFYSLPKIALAPLFILWIGIGMKMMTVLTRTVVFFLVFLNTFRGFGTSAGNSLPSCGSWVPRSATCLARWSCLRPSPVSSPASASPCPMS